MATMKFIEDGKKRLFGEPQIGLSPREVRRNVRLGPTRDETWPGNQVEWNPTAAEYREVSETAE